MELFAGVPQDLAMECLVRLPYRSHSILRAVSKSWNTLLTSQCFFELRRRRGMLEDGIISLNKTGGSDCHCDFTVTILYPRAQFYERLPQIPKQYNLQYTEYNRCVFLRSKQQVIIVGLLNRCSRKEGVLIFDFVSRKWRLGADMPKSRCYFACAASRTESLLYVGGGCETPFRRKYSRPLADGFVYNVDENKWDSLPAMASSVRFLHLCVGVFLDHKFYVVPRRSQMAQVYDTITRVWRSIEGDSNAAYIHTCVSTCAGFWYFNWRECTKGWINVTECNRSTGRGLGRLELRDYSGEIEGIVGGFRNGFFITTVDLTASGCRYYNFDALGNTELPPWWRWSRYLHFPGEFSFSSEVVQI